MILLEYDANLTVTHRTYERSQYINKCENIIYISKNSICSCYIILVVVVVVVIVPLKTVYRLFQIFHESQSCRAREKEH